MLINPNPYIPWIKEALKERLMEHQAEEMKLKEIASTNTSEN
jgi:hypothetical protein